MATAVDKQTLLISQIADAVRLVVREELAALETKREVAARIAAEHAKPAAPSKPKPKATREPAAPKILPPMKTTTALNLFVSRFELDVENVRTTYPPDDAAAPETWGAREWRAHGRAVWGSGDVPEADKREYAVRAKAEKEQAAALAPAAEPDAEPDAK